MTRDDWKSYEKIQNKDDVLLAMRARCEERGHDYENCASVTLRIYQRCKWCKEERT